MADPFGDQGPRRRSSLTSSKRMSLHLQRLADQQGISPDVDDRPQPAPRRLSFAPSVDSHQSARIEEEPVVRWCVHAAVSSSSSSSSSRRGHSRRQDFCWGCSRCTLLL